jgi:HSP20 family protein
MKNFGLVIIGIIIVFMLGTQTLMFYRINENIEQRFALENKLNLSSHQGSDSWIQDTENWNPYQELFQMRDQVERLFDDSMSRFHKNSATGSLIKIPAVNLKDEKDSYVITTDVPGADEPTLHLALNGRQVTISIKTENEHTTDKTNYQRRERFAGEYQCSLTLPGDASQTGMKTEYNKGVLTITLPKAK